MEEGLNTASCIHCGRFVVGNSGEAQKFEPELLFVVHERMSGVLIFLDVVRNERTGQCALQLLGDSLLPAALAAIASNDRAGCLKKTVDVGRKLPP